MNTAEMLSGVGALAGAAVLGYFGFRIHWWLGVLGVPAGFLGGFYLGLLCCFILLSPLILLDWLGRKREEAKRNS